MEHSLLEEQSYGVPTGDYPPGAGNLLPDYVEREQIAHKRKV